MFDLSGRVARVTGGSVGLGRQMAEGLAEMGANLVLCARNKERCLPAAEELPKLGVQVLALGCAVKQPSGIQELADAIVKQFGRIDGYWRQPDASAEALRGGWFPTGDLARPNEEGYLLIVDRKKDIIVSGGESISSPELEKSILAHPAEFGKNGSGVRDR